MSKLTPGPWYAHPLTLQVVDKKVWFDEDGSRHGDTPNMVIDCISVADTHLIAAAPDLLAALEAAVECGLVPLSSAKEGGAVRYARQVVVADQIREAIDKAKGGAA